jgi:hypothetical protein
VINTQALGIGQDARTIVGSKPMDVWTKPLHQIYDKAVRLYREGNRDVSTYFDKEELEFLSSIGSRPMSLYDFAEDFVTAGEPDWDTVLLIIAARRDYFLVHQKGQWTDLKISSEDLPPKKAELEGIEWLPRILQKAKCYLEGGLCEGIMYCCGGDRALFSKHGLHPADFLRAMWATHGDPQRMLKYVQTGEKEF